MWSDGRKSWIKESNMPKRVLENIKAGKKIQHVSVSVSEFGQERHEFQLNEKHSDNVASSTKLFVKR